MPVPFQYANRKQQVSKDVGHVLGMEEGNDVFRTETPIALALPGRYSTTMKPSSRLSGQEAKYMCKAFAQ